MNNKKIKEIIEYLNDIKCNYKLIIDDNYENEIIYDQKRKHITYYKFDDIIVIFYNNDIRYNKLYDIINK